MNDESRRSDDWMTANDAVIWEIERDPVLRSPITAVIWFDSPPDATRIDAMVDRLIDRMPRLRQRVAPSPARLSTPKWERDPGFHRSFHVRRIDLPPDRSSRRDVLDHAQRMAERAFDRDRPPWEMDFLGRTDDGGGVCVMRFHHAIADGLGLVSMMQHMVDLERDPVESGDPPGRSRRPAIPESTVARRVAEAVAHRAETDTDDVRRAVTAGWRTAAEFARHPVDTARRIAATGASIAKVVAPATSPLSPLMTERSTSIRMETVDVELAAVKAAANTHGATVNDAFVTIVADALDRYHRDRGRPAEAIRMHMPVSVRDLGAPGKLDNQFTPTRFVVPLGRHPLADRLAAVRELLHHVRSEPALPHTADITSTVRRLGETATIALVGAMMKGVDVTTSNVPGPPFRVFLAGSEVTDFYGFGPLAGSAINLTLFSYDGRARIAISIDSAAVADPTGFVGDLEAAAADFIALMSQD